MNTGKEYIVFAILSLEFGLSDLYLTEANVTWSTAKLKCRDENTTLPSIMDVHKYPYESFKFTSVWSSVRGAFTPWITSIGCYTDSQQFAWPHRRHPVPDNTVGKCYQLCNYTDNSSGGCKSSHTFFFGLNSRVCICICPWNHRNFLTDSRHCNTPCLSSIENGFCGGGNNYISIYKNDVGQNYVSRSRFGGFCLACMQNHNNIVHFGVECDEPTKGFCVDEHEVLTLVPLRKTMDDYWMYCKSINQSVTAKPICSGKTGLVWTGLRKYRISNGNTEDNCYSLEQIADSDWVYKRRGCNESLPFICKPSTIYTSQSTKMKTTETSTRTTEKKSTHLLPLYTDKTDSYFTLSSTLIPNSLKNPGSLPPHTVTNFKNASPVAYATSAIINMTIRSPMQNIRKKEPNSGTIGAIVGSCVAVIIVCICVSIILLFLRLKKKRNTQKTSIKFTNTSQDKTSIDIHVNTNLQPTLTDQEEVYVEKVDGEYDTLNNARQKKSYDGDLNYDCATGSENCYSSTAQSKYSYQETTYGSDYNTMVGNNYNKNSTKNNDYDTCNQFVTVGGDVYAQIKK